MYYPDIVVDRTKPTISPIKWPLANDEWFWFHKLFSGHYEPIEDEV